VTFSIESILPYAIALVAQLEGPYKWYIMGGVAFILTAFITRYIFKTFKWFLLLLLVITVIVGALYALVSFGTPTNRERILDGYLNEEAN
jgi:hypothetical protein